MGAKSPQVDLNPSLIRWARESVGASLADVGTALKVGDETVRRWESGEEAPTLRALEALASFCKRPLAVFLLPEPPQDAPLPEDFRSLPGRTLAPLSRKSRIVVRRAQRLQALAGDLLVEMGLSRATRVMPLTLDADAEQVADRERRRLAVTVQQQERWRSDEEAFRAWRSALEMHNVFVFRFPMPLDDSRGFSLTHSDPPAIVVNSSDSPPARVFTLFHEYAHVLLQIGGLCLVEEVADSGIPIESFCNRFAGAFLVPKSHLLGDERIRDCPNLGSIDDASLRAVASRFRVSRYVIWRRLLSLDRLSPSAYWDRLKRWQALPSRPRRGRPLSRPEKCLRQRGRRFASLVLEAAAHNIITYRDAMDCLGVGARDVADIESRLHGG